MKKIEKQIGEQIILFDHSGREGVFTVQNMTQLGLFVTHEAGYEYETMVDSQKV